MKNPITSAILGFVGVVAIGSFIASQGPAPSDALAAGFPWFLMACAVFAMCGSVVQIVSPAPTR